MLNLKQAAEIVGVHPRYLADLIKRRNLDVGIIDKDFKKTKYMISEQKLRKVFGLEAGDV